jgi:hypothetical protein
MRFLLYESDLQDAIKSHTAKGGIGASNVPWKTEYFKILKSACKKQQPIIVWRGLWFKEREWDKIYEQWINPGSVIEFKGIQSFTKDKIRASAYGSGGEIFVKLEMRLHKYLDISKNSVYPQEEEVIAVDFKWRVNSAEYKNSWQILGEQI